MPRNVKIARAISPGLCERHDHVPEDSPLARPVDARRLVEAGRDRQHELPQEKRPELAERRRQDQPRVRVEQAKLHHDGEIGDHRHDAGYHERREVQLEDRCLGQRNCANAYAAIARSGSANVTHTATNALLK